MPNRNLRIYRPNGSNTGCATDWQLSYKENEKYDPWQFFLVGSKQTGTDKDGNASFDWKETKLNVKLGIPDLGQILAVLERRVDSVGTKGSLFHNTPSGGNKVVGFSRNENGGFALSISGQDKEKKSTGRVSQVLQDWEGAVLAVMIKRAIELMILDA